MKTDDLIDRLGREASAVTPLPAPEIRTAAWLIWGGLYLVAAAAMIFTATSPDGANVTPLYLLQQGAAAAMAITAARAAFASVVPGTSTRLWVLPAASAAVWVISLLWGGALDLQASGTLGITGQTDWPCVISMLWHGVTVVMAATLSAWIGSRWLRWPALPVY